jgi:glutamyl-tRNA synthetase
VGCRTLSGIERAVLGYALRDAVKHGGRARVDSVMSMILGDRPELRAQARVIVEVVRRVVDEVNRMSLEEQRARLKAEFPELLEERVKVEGREVLQPLPGAIEGKVVVRFAPNPDFYIHLGNARPAILCSEYARMYRGKMVLRFEDTDPRTKTPLKEVYDAIRGDLRWLGVVWHEEYIQSLRLNIYYDIAREMLRRGCAYVDLCGDESKKLLSKGSYCPDRDRDPSWHLEQFDRMLEGAYSEGEAVVRVKTDPRHPNPSVRDWVALRVIDTTRHPHPIVGSKYIVWPTYNYAVSVDDHLMGVTHVIRGREHEVNTTKQLYVYKCMSWEPPVFVHIGRLKLEGFILSKSKIRELLAREPEKFLGYDDPRFGTIAALRRRGVLPEAIRELILSVGAKETDATISWANLASINRRLLDPIADRIMYVSNPEELVYEGGCVDAEIPYHPERPERRTIRLCNGDVILVNREDVELKEVRLMGAVNVKFEGGKAVMTSRDLRYAKEKKLQIVQWVPKRDAVKLTIYKPEGLEMKKIEGYAENTLKAYKVDSKLQLIRFGFIRIDGIEEDGSYKAFLIHE